MDFRLQLVCIIGYLFILDLEAQVCKVTVPCDCCLDDSQCKKDEEYWCHGPCKAGFWGAGCKKSCPSECISCNQTFSKHPECYGCKSGYSGSKCTCSNNCKKCDKPSGDCTECQTGYFGESCNRKCSETCKDKTCNFTTGACFACTGEFYGNTCNATCPRNCQNNTCRQMSGLCNECIAGYFGPNCQMLCPSNCHGDVCDRNSGGCVACRNRFYGKTCDRNCSATCKNKVCEKTSGSCIECPVGKHGNFCSETCPDTCHEDTCNKSTGFCTYGCNKNFQGNTCQTCTRGKFGLHCEQSCSPFCNNTECDNEIGTCVEGCMSGSSDSRYCCVNNTHCKECSSPVKCLKCKDGKYGEMCEADCSSICNGTCDRQTGNCDILSSRFLQEKEQNAGGITVIVSVAVSLGIVGIAVIAGGSLIFYRRRCISMRDDLNWKSSTYDNLQSDRQVADIPYSGLKITSGKEPEDENPYVNTTI